jgi:hypothetical protein
MALHLIESSWKRAACNVAGSLALGIGVVTASLGSGYAQSPKLRAQTVIAPRVALPPAQKSKLIAQAHCNFLFDSVTDKLEKEGKNFISVTTRRGLNTFFAYGPDELPRCNGPESTRLIPWETGRDFDFIMALADSASLAFKEQKVDFRADYGFKPAERPTVRGTPVGRAPGSTAPALAAK